MKRKILILFVMTELILVGIFIGFNINKEEATFDDSSESKQVVRENTLSMMIEQTAGAGDYKMETRSTWPTDGYMFNETLSKCENGGELGWDSEKGVVTMTGNMSDKCYIYFDLYSAIKINSYSIEASSNNINITINASNGTSTIVKYFYSKDNGATYVESTSNTYSYNNLSNGTYTVKAYVQDANGKNSSIVSKSLQVEKKTTLAEYIINLYNTNGTSGTNIYYHNGSLTNGINDGSYRYAGASSSVNNYVCFGSDPEACPTDNLYRIIGVFGDQVKLIKASFASSTLLGIDGDYYSSTSYYWNYKNNTSINNGYGSNTWSTSLLNKTNLNTNYITYLNNINTKWAKMIATTTWKVGGNTSSNIASAVPKTAYANEIVNPTPTSTSTTGETEYPAKIGLMYVSDYGFAADYSAWPTALNSYSSYTSVNWMHMSEFEWTISRSSDDAYVVFRVGLGGYVGSISANGSSCVRPVFYLENFVTYISGNGSQNSPIRIN